MTHLFNMLFNLYLYYVNVGDSALKKQKFSELGARWKDLTDSQKEDYREKARNLKDSVRGLTVTDSQRSKRIVKNIMKEVITQY